MALFLVGCGSDSTTENTEPPAQEAAEVQPTPATPDRVRPAATAQADASTEVETAAPAPIHKYYVRFYYVAEDEQVNATTCAIKTVGLAMEYQIKSLTKVKFDLLKERSDCKIDSVHEYETGNDYELRCDLTDNFMYFDALCGSNKTVQYRHYYRPNLESWGPSAMPEPGYAYGGTSI